MKIRSLVKSDLPILCSLIHELADFEKLADACRVSVKDLEKAIFEDERPPLVFMCENAGEIVGYMIAFFNFSTFLGKKGIYLEDLYIRPAHRGKGFGKKALTHLAKLATEFNCSRLEWSVLDWNTPAIEFYKSLGAEPLSDWTMFRITGSKLQSLASGAE